MSDQTEHPAPVGPKKALEIARQQFRLYEAHHRVLADGVQIEAAATQGSAAELVHATELKAERTRKAETNRLMAEMCERAAAEPVWPDTFTLIPPRDPEGRPTDPVLDVLQMCSTPWVMKDIWGALRQVGYTIATNMEAETSIAMHWLLGHAIRDGANWRQAAMDELKRLKAEKEAK